MMLGLMAPLLLVVKLGARFPTWCVRAAVATESDRLSKFERECDGSGRGEERKGKRLDVMDRCELKNIEKSVYHGIESSFNRCRF